MKPKNYLILCVCVCMSVGIAHYFICTWRFGNHRDPVVDFPFHQRPLISAKRTPAPAPLFLQAVARPLPGWAQPS